jgi:hypothetical protein
MARASSTAALAALLGVGTYLWVKADSSTGEMLSVAILVVSILAAAAIGRRYVLASLAGPFLALVVLESQDYIGNDGVQPLGFVMLFTNLFWTALALLVGLGAHRVFNSWRGEVSGADRR